MYTSTEVQLLRNADPGVKLPGIDTAAGDPVATAALNPLSSISKSSTAPFYYDPADNAVIVKQKGAVLSGYNFGSASVDVEAANVTIEDSTFTSTTGTNPNVGCLYTIAAINYLGAANTTVTDCTFNSNGVYSPLAAWIGANTSVTVTGNRFLDTPSDGLDLSGGGTVSGNYFSGSGYNSTGIHPDGIWLTNSSTPFTISDNFMDETQNPGSTGDNDCIRITSEGGSISNVKVIGNYLLGGETSIDAGNEGAGSFGNISITGNYMGFAKAYAFFPGPHAGVTASDNIVFDYTNATYSTQAWAAYESAGLPTRNLLTSSNGSTVFASSETGPTTLYGSPGGRLFGGSYENNFVGGYGQQEIFGGQGANVFTYLSPADSTPANLDLVFAFDPAKDVIDLSHIDANVTPGVSENFTFIGTNAFSSAGGQVRYQLETANDTTLVQATMAGDSTPDVQFQISGLVPLTAANFALTASQSQSDLANGAALSVSHVDSGSALECLYSNVKGKSYSSYESFASAWYGGIGADDLNLSTTSNKIELQQNGLTLTRAAGAESLAIGNGSFALAYHANETIEAPNNGSETFALSDGYGKETIDGFAASGTAADVLKLSTSDFSYLNSGMTQAQDLAAVLSHATSSAGGLTIADTHGDSLTLAGVSATTLTANPGAVKFG